MHGINTFLGFTAGIIVVVVLVQVSMYLAFVAQSVAVAP